MKKILITLVLVVMLGSCTPKRNAPSVFSGQVCGKSCWNNMIVGKVEEQEFLDTISTLPNIDPTSITMRDKSTGSWVDGEIVLKYYRVLGDDDSVVNISALTKDQKVILMNFQGDLGLTFQDITDMFGEPELVSSIWTFDGGINVRFINSLQGLQITRYFPSEKADVSPDTTINNLNLFDPSLYQEFMETSLLTGDYQGFILYPWTGYGKIEDLYWPPR